MNEPNCLDPEGLKYISLQDMGERISLVIQLNGMGAQLHFRKNAGGAEVVVGLRKLAARLEKIMIQSDLSRN